jgi:RNA polymerase sigma-70 factor (ECF subfamily)
MGAMDDREIIRRAQAGDRHAFGALFDAYYPSVYRYLYERLGGSPEAEDLCQEVFLDVLSSIDEYPCDGALGFDEWLLRVARRLAQEHHGAKVRRQRVRTHSGSDLPDKTATARRLNPAAVALLSEQQRQIVLRRYDAGLSVRQTAATLHVESAFVRRIEQAAMETWVRCAPAVDDPADPS